MQDDDGSGGDAEGELRGLVAEEEHARNQTRGTTDQRQRQQPGFRNAPLTLSGAVFVVSGGGEGRDADGGDPGQKHDGAG